MRHQDLTLNHILESWTYANAAARTGATGFVAGDVGRIAYQQDNGTYWRLTATTPTWAALGATMPAGGTQGQALRKNTGTDYDASWRLPNQTQSGPSGQNYTNTTAAMGGFAVSYTPTAATVIVFFYSGVGNSTAANYIQCQIRYGTGTAPIKGAAVTGTPVGTVTTASCQTAGGNGQYGTLFSVGIVAGLTPGTTYWFDVSVVVSGGTGTLFGPWFAIHDL